MKRGEPDLATDWEALPAGAIARGYLVKQPGRTELRQLKHGRLLTWPADQPRHAIRTSAIRSKPVRPRVRRTTEPPGPRRPHRPSAVSAARLLQGSKAAGLERSWRRRGLFSARKHRVAANRRLVARDSFPGGRSAAAGFRPPARSLTLLSCQTYPASRREILRPTGSNPVLVPCLRPLRPVFAGSSPPASCR